MRCPAFVPGFVYPLTAPPFLLIPESELRSPALSNWADARMKIAAPVKGRRSRVGFMVAKRVEDGRGTLRARMACFAGRRGLRRLPRDEWVLRVVDGARTRTLRRRKPLLHSASLERAGGNVRSEERREG